MCDYICEEMLLISVPIYCLVLADKSYTFVMQTKHNAVYFVYKE